MTCITTNIPNKNNSYSWVLFLGFAVRFRNWGRRNAKRSALGRLNGSRGAQKRRDLMVSWNPSRTGWLKLKIQDFHNPEKTMATSNPSQVDGESENPCGRFLVQFTAEEQMTLMVWMHTPGCILYTHQVFYVLCTTVDHYYYTARTTDVSSVISY